MLEGGGMLIDADIFSIFGAYSSGDVRSSMVPNSLSSSNSSSSDTDVIGWPSACGSCVRRCLYQVSRLPT